MSHVLAIDQGTTNTKALLFGSDGMVVARGSRPVALVHPEPGWAEQCSEAIWSSVVEAASECLMAAGPREVAAGAGTKQPGYRLVWGGTTGRPVGPCVSWQCGRSAGRLAALATPERERVVAERTGLALSPMFSAAKIGWLLDEVPEARQRAKAGELCAGTVDSWLVFRLTGGA